MARLAGSGAPRVGSQQYRAQTRRRPAQKIPPQRPKPGPKGSAFGPLDRPFAGVQRQARSNVRRARNRLPQQQTHPSLPRLAHPTPAQRRTASGLEQRSLTQKRLPGESGTQAAHRLESSPRLSAGYPTFLHPSHAQRSAARAYGRQLAAAPRLRPGPKPKGGIAGVAGVPLGAISSHLLSPRYNAFLALAPAVGKLGGPVVRDAVSLPRNAVVSGFVAGRALEKAARGNPQELKQLGHTVWNTDPILLAGQGRFREAVKAAGTHPLSTALELSGVRAPLRGLGRLGRVSTEREVASLPGTSLSKAREFSPNPLYKPLQRGRDVRRVAKADALRSQAEHLDQSGHPEEADAVRAEANRADPRVMSEAQVEHRADVRESMGQPGRRRGRTQVQAQMRPTYVRPREGGHLQRLHVEGSVPIRRVDDAGNFDFEHGQISVKHMREDIAGKLERLKAEEGDSGWKAAKKDLDRARDEYSEARQDPSLSDRHREEVRAEVQVAEKKLKGLKPPQPGRFLRLNRRTQRHLQDLLGKSDQQLLNVAHKSLDVSAITNGREATVIARNMLDPEEARIARLKTYAFEHMGAKVGRAEAGKREQLLDRNGRPLSPDRIEQHAQAHGANPDEFAFVTQRPTGTVGAYNMRWEGAKGASTRTRTGAAVIQGLVDTHPRNLTANAVRLQQLEAANINWEHGLSEVAQRSGRGKVRAFGSKQQATNAAKEVEARTGMKWRAVQMIPWGGRQSQLQHFLDHADSEGFVGANHPISQAVERAVSDDATGQGPWALVPDAWAQRIAEHSQVYRSSHPVMRTITGMFRHTVLPLSLKWLTGNFTEAALRTTIKSPRIIHNFSTYKRVLGALEKFDPEEAAQVKDILGVGHYGSMEQSDTFRSAASFSNSNLALRKMAQWAETVRHAEVKGVPLPPKLVADGYARWVHFVFNTVNDRLETPWRQSMAGHHIRMALMDNSRAVRNSQQAIEDAAKGLKNTTAQVRMADDVRRAYGQYEAWSPNMRKTILNWTPFLPWFVNAVKFFTTVLPKDHPALTAAIAAADTMTTDYRKQHGLEEGSAGAVPSFLFGSIPTAGGGHLRFQYTPSAAFSDPLGTLSQQVLPQYSGFLAALAGRDWTGKELKNKDGSPLTTAQRLEYGAGQFGQSVVPGLSVVSRAVAAPGSNPAAKLWYTQNPFRPVKKKGASSVSSSPVKGGAVGGPVDWSRVKLPEQSGGVDWSKVKIGGGG